MRILAIDPGSRCGWAYSSEERIESGVQDFSLRRGESVGMRFIRFTAWLDEMINLIKPKLIIFEMAHHRGGAATNILIGMTTRIEEKCEKMKIEYTSVHSATVKKFATGKGNASKEAMLAKAIEHYPDIGIIDDNHADALFMLGWAKEEFDR